jgi:hypothetical protein
MFHGKMKALTIHEMKFLCEEHKKLLKELIVEYDLDTLVCEWPVWVLYEVSFYLLGFIYMLREIRTRK